jgi:hypothetical protein
MIEDIPQEELCDKISSVVDVVGVWVTLTILFGPLIGQHSDL